ncbi:MAG: hypothetical protein WC807_06600 [Hyphomicrobium sp.]|jgi:hypothetical protein
MLRKSLAIAAALAATVSLATEVSAGGCHHGGFHRLHLSYNVFQPKRSFRSASLVKHRQSYDVKQAQSIKRKPAIEVADASEPKALDVKAAETATPATTINASDAKAEATSTETSAPIAVAAVDTTCKRFVAAVGATVSIDCTELPASK